MSIKGTIRPDHIQRNKYQFLVVGFPILTPVNVGELDEELEMVTLPDRTNASTGNTKPLTTEISIPSHHHDQILAMEGWMIEGKDPVSPVYKKLVTYTFQSAGGTNERSYSLLGVFCRRRITPEGEMENEGELAVIRYELSIDEIVPSL